MWCQENDALISQDKPPRFRFGTFTKEEHVRKLVRRFHETTPIRPIRPWLRNSRVSPLRYDRFLGIDVLGPVVNSDDGASAIAYGDQNARFWRDFDRLDSKVTPVRSFRFQSAVRFVTNLHIRLPQGFRHGGLFDS